MDHPATYCPLCGQAMTVIGRWGYGLARTIEFKCPCGASATLTARRPPS